MKNKIILTGLASFTLAMLPASGQSLLAGWDFGNASSGDTSVDANFTDLGAGDGPGASVFGALDLTNLVDDSNFETWGDVDSANSLSANRAIDFADNRTVGVNDTFGTANSLRVSDHADGEFFQFDLTLGSSYTDFEFSYAAAVFNSGNTGTVQWSYSADGSGFTNVGAADTVTGLFGSSEEENQISLGAVSATNLSIRGTLSSFGTGDEMLVDNFQVGGNAVPEPSSFALIAGVLSIAFVGARRRK